MLNQNDSIPGVFCHQLREPIDGLTGASNRRDERGNPGGGLGLASRWDS